jgi:hypothetical protein
MTQTNEKEIVQWGYELIRNLYLNKSVSNDYESELYLNYLLPYSLEFFGTHNPALLFGGHGVRELGKKPFISARDGLVPLAIFFNEMNPEDLKFNLFIEKDFWFLVPPKWRSKVKFYEVCPDIIYNAVSKPKKIFISGILNSTFIEPDEIDVMLIDLKKSLGLKNFKDIEIMAYMPDKRNDLWGSWEEENILNFSKKLFTHLKLELQTPLWEDIKSMNGFQDYLYLELNAKVFVADSYVRHFALSRGAGMLEKKPSLIDSYFNQQSCTRASLYHTIKFYDLDYSQLDDYEDPINEKTFSYYKSFYETQRKDKNINFRWESWYASYITNYYKGSKTNKSFLEKF